MLDDEKAYHIAIYTCSLSFSRRMHSSIFLDFFFFLQEIDGQSLLLMKRSDVLTGLSIRLGPALKMYQHVMKLQLGGMDTAN